MCELTNQQAYDYYHEAVMPRGKDYWLNFLQDRANRGVQGAQDHVNKIEFCENKQSGTLINEGAKPALLY